MKRANDTLVKIMQVFRSGIHGYIGLIVYPIGTRAGREEWRGKGYIDSFILR